MEVETREAGTTGNASLCLVGCFFVITELFGYFLFKWCHIGKELVFVASAAELRM